MSSDRVALGGRVVTMDDRWTVHDDGVVFIEGERIVDVRDRSAGLPEGYEATETIDTGGTLYPGLIELHNHLAYNALPIWEVPRTFANRAEWQRLGEKRRRISGPMEVLRRRDHLAAVVRYVECKALLAGVTTSQGITLVSAGGMEAFFMGLVRNVEAPGHPELARADAKIGDIGPGEAEDLARRLARTTCYLLHLAEGVDDVAREFFLNLKLPAERGWAVSRSLAGIHCTALRDEDFAVMGAGQASMVWSPLSNLLLYGATADLDSARRHKVPISLGSDWSPTGSRNLLAELRVAAALGNTAEPTLQRRDLVAMVTKTPADTLGWPRLGRIESEALADIVVVRGTGDDPYGHLLRADEQSLTLVVIGGRPRAGTPALMKPLGATGETITIAGEQRVVALAEPQSNPQVASISLERATHELEEALAHLPELAAGLDRASVAEEQSSDEWMIELDQEIDYPGIEAAPPLADVLIPLPLDPLTVAGDPAYYEVLARQRNLPEGLVQDLI
jgi:5-methylthioadenosine/S-adenosylhomocysteine deaminase